MTAMMLEQGDALDFVIFGLESRLFALPASSVTEIVRAVWITSVPGAPRVVEGVINYKGTLVPVLDVRVRFGLSPRPVHTGDLLIIANARTRLVALRSDGQASVRRIHDTEIETDGDALSRSRFVAGLAKSADGTIVIHDLAAFLSEAESAALDQALVTRDAGVAV